LPDRPPLTGGRQPVDQIDAEAAAVRFGVEHADVEPLDGSIFSRR
jgi:hypothetical protein